MVPRKANVSEKELQFESWKSENRFDLSSLMKIGYSIQINPFFVAELAAIEHSNRKIHSI
jgi:hypothetical protein